MLTVAVAAIIFGCGNDTSNPPDGTTSSNSSPVSSGIDPAESLSPSTDDIWEAASSGDLTVVKQYIASGRDINARKENGTTPLNAACVYGRSEVAKNLLDAGADADIKNNEGTSALFNAAFFSHPEIVESILNKGADVNTTDRNGTPLPAIMEAPWEAELEGIHKFVYGLVGVPFEAEQVRSTRPQIARMLSEYANRTSGTGQTTRPPAPTDEIYTAVLADNISAVKAYIAAGADLNSVEPGGGATALNVAAVLGNAEAANLLIAAGANLEKTNNEGATPLFNAAFFCHPQIVTSLLNEGANINVTDRNGIPILAIMQADWSAIEAVYTGILKAINIQRDMREIRKMRPEIVRILQEHAQKTPDSASAIPSTSATATVQMDRVAPVTQGDWATYNCNFSGWRFNQHENILSPENIGQLELKWRFPRDGSDTKIGVIHATPSVVDGYVYFGTSTYGAFYCLSPQGEVVWKYDVGDAGRQAYRKYAETRGLSPQDGVYTSALVTDDSVYFADVAGIMYCLERETGNEVWQVNSKAGTFPGAHPTNLVMASPILADGTVVFGGGGYEHAQPAVDRNYKCCSGRGFVIALNPQSGDVVWKYDVGPPPEEFDPPLVTEDEYGKHVFDYGPSTSSVWCTPSWDEESNTVFFGTDTHNAPRKPTKDDPRNYTPHSCAVIAVDAKNGAERWVSQISPGDVWNHSMPAYDTNTKRYKDLSIGDTPKVYTIEVDGKQTPVVGAGCKNGGFYVLHRATGKLIANTPVYTGPPTGNPTTDPRMLALPGPIGGLQTGCATDGERIFTNGIDRLPLAPLEYLKPNPPTGGRITAISTDAKNEFWRHERPKLEWIGGTQEQSGFRDCGDPIASGIAVANGLIFCTTFSSNKLLCVNAKTGALMKDFPLGPVLCGPSVSRGQVYVGTGNTQFSNTPGEAYFPKKYTGELLVFGLPDINEEQN